MHTMSFTSLVGPLPYIGIISTAGSALFMEQHDAARQAHGVPIILVGNLLAHRNGYVCVLAWAVRIDVTS